MKEPNVLKDFSELENKTIVLYDCDNYDDEFMKIFITNSKEILIFKSRIDWDEAVIETFNISDINGAIIRDKYFRELLLDNEITDKEYVDNLLMEHQIKQEKNKEEIRLRKLSQYNQLKEELGL